MSNPRALLPLALTLPLLSGAAPAAPALDPSKGQEIGLVYEAFLSPMQEPDEESNTPSGTPTQFKSTAPSKTRAERVAANHRGHATVRFTKDLSKAYVDVKIDGIKVDDINMFHIHCGKPGILGPILADFSHVTDIKKNFSDNGVFSVEITNDLLTQTTAHAHGVVGTFTTGCVIPSPSLGGAVTKVSTVSGMATIAQEGELYFNLHTVGQTYFGDIRGQWYPVK